MDGNLETVESLLKERQQEVDAQDRVSYMILLICTHTSLSTFLCASTWRVIAGLLIILSDTLVISPSRNRMDGLPSHGPAIMDF